MDETELLGRGPVRNGSHTGAVLVTNESERSARKAKRCASFEAPHEPRLGTLSERMYFWRGES